MAAAAAAASLHHSLLSLRPPPPSATPSSQISSSLRPCLDLRRLPSLKLSAPLRRRRRPRGTVMMDSAAASYATALSDVAKSNGTLEATVADMEKVETMFSDPSVGSFFANPTVPIEKKIEMIEEIVASSEIQPHVANFLNILVDMNRIELVKDIVKEFEFCYNRITGTEVAVVSSVVKLDSEHLAQMAKAVQRVTGAKNVRIKTVIDPSLVAGFTIRYGNSGSKLIDMSVKKQLDEIAAQLDFSSISLA